MIPARLPPMLFDREPNSFVTGLPGPWRVEAAQVYQAGQAEAVGYTPTVTGQTFQAGAEQGEAHA